MRWADIQAATALVQQVPVLSSATFVSTVPKPVAPATTQPLPYAVVHPSGGTDEATRFIGPASTEHPSFTLHLVGGSAEQVSALCDLLKPILTPDVHPSTGRRTSRIWWREPLPIQEDTDVNPPLIFAVIEFGWRSDPA